MKTTSRSYPWLLAACLFSFTLRAAEFAPVFVDNAVLQRETPIHIWGTGRDGEAVTVELLGKSAKTTVVKGQWQVDLPAMPAAENGTLTLKGDNETQLHNVAIGEVWIGSGQSNMEWRLSGCAPLYDALLASANDPGIRELKVPLRTSTSDPLGKLQWKTSEKGAAAAQFGAVAYFFAAELRHKLGVVVGVVNCSYGGTPIQAWMTKESILSAGAKEIIDEDARKSAAFATPEAYEKAWQEWQTLKKDRDQRKKSGATSSELGPDPKEPYGYHNKEYVAALDSAMLGVIRPYTARGVLWYQGENNAGAPNYAALLSGFIASLRQQWNRPDWPFLVAQISTPSAYQADNGENYPLTREAQRSVATTTPHCGFVVTLDFGEKGTVHPKQKQPVGERLARLAMGRVYGKQGFAPQSAWAAHAKKDGTAVVVTFADLPGRLELRDPALPTLEIQTSSGGCQPAKGELSADGKSLRVSLPEGLSHMKAVRYGWRNYCTLSIYSDEGLPVSPWNLPIQD